MYTLISVTRDELTIITTFHKTKEEAREAMVQDILESTQYNTVDEIVEAADAGLCGFSDDEAWAETHHQGTGQWSIVPVPTEESELTELVHNENGSVYRLENIPPKMFEFFLHKRRTYKDGTSQWNIGVSPSEATNKGYVFSSIRGNEDDAKKEFEQICSNFNR